MDGNVPENGKEKSGAVSHDLLPNRRKKELNAMKAPYSVKRITFNPSEANPGERLEVRVPKLNKNEVLVPGSLALRFDIDLSGGHANNHLVQNVSRALVSQQVVKFGGTTLDDIVDFDVYKIFTDLFLPEETRGNMVAEGIQSKKLSQIRSGAGDKPTTGVDAENKLEKVYGKKYRINLDHQIMTDHGVFYPHFLTGHGAQIDQKPELIFGVVLLQSHILRFVFLLHEEANGLPPGILAFDAVVVHHVWRAVDCYMYFFKVKKAVFFRISRPRSVRLHEQEQNSFQGSSLRVDFDVNQLGRRVDPHHGISAHVVIHDLFAIFVNTCRFICKVFTADHFILQLDVGELVFELGFVRAQYHLVGGREDQFKYEVGVQSLHGNGTRLVNSTDGVQLEIKRATGKGPFNCHIFVISDALFNIQNRQLSSVQY